MNNYAFIDSQNLYLSIKSQGWKLDYKRFRRYLQDKYAVSKAYLFIGYTNTNELLYTSLQEYGYIVVFKPTLMLKNGTMKGNVDAELVLHTMIEYPNYDEAVIVSGDGDFFCLVDYLINRNKLQKLIVPDRSKFSSLYNVVKIQPYMGFMNDLKGKLEYK